MDANITPILAYGSLSVAVAVSALVLLVRRDLAPSGAFSGAFDGGGRWFLGGALGLGVIAFGIKLAIISTLASFPDQTITAMLPDPAETRARAASRPATKADGPAEALPPRSLAWQPLPLVAPAPPDNPTTAEKVALGRRLFDDARLSADGTVACASCHDLARGGGADRRATAIGITGTPGRRNTPTVINAAFQERLFWDGRAASLEQQALGPLLNPVEMGMPSAEAVVARVADDPSYRPAFAQAFGADVGIDIQRIAQAIAAYERTLITPDTPYDRFVRGDGSALNAAQQRGMALFASLGCVTCHSGPNFSGAARVGPRSPYAVLNATGTAYDGRYGLTADKGRASATARDGIWRIPSLRNVALTGPYFHNGSVADLPEAVRIMAALQVKALVGSPPPEARMDLWWRDGDRSLIAVRRKAVDDQDVADIVAFLRGLSSDRLAQSGLR